MPTRFLWLLLIGGFAVAAEPVISLTLVRDPAQGRTLGCLLASASPAPTGELTVPISIVTGSTASTGTDYESLGTAIRIFAQEDVVTVIPITATAAAGIGKTIIVRMADGTGYALNPSATQVTLTIRAGFDNEDVVIDTEPDAVVLTPGQPISTDIGFVRGSLLENDLFLQQPTITAIGDTPTGDWLTGLTLQPIASSSDRLVRLRLAGPAISSSLAGKHLGVRVSIPIDIDGLPNDQSLFATDKTLTQDLLFVVPPPTVPAGAN